MGIFSRFESKMEDGVESAAAAMSKGPISPVQIAKKAEKQMKRGVMVGAGKEYAPTLYTVLVNPDDDARMTGYYPTLAGETETYLEARAAQEGLVMDGHPLVRFIVDDTLRHGKFDIIAETVAAPIVSQLRDEEMERYGIKPRRQQQRPVVVEDNDYVEDEAYEEGQAFGYESYMPKPAEPPVDQVPMIKPPLPYVPEEEIDRSIDYGEYTFNSEDFEDYRAKVDNDDLAAAQPHYGEGVPQARQAQQPQQARQPQQVQAANTVAFTAGAGANAAPDHRAVTVRLVDKTYHRVYDLAGTHMTIGRESSNDIVVQDINASRKHAELRLNTRGIWVISDLGSMNGTRINGVSVASQPLYPGDTVTIGKTEYQFVLA